MSQHDFDIITSDANTGITFRAALNAALQALAGCSSGGSAPATPYPFQFWADTTGDQLKQRNAANTDWIVIGTLSAVNLGLAVATNVLSLAGGTLTGALTLAGAGTEALHPATLAQIQSGAMSYAVDTGVADAYVIALSPVLTADPGSGIVVGAKIINANTTTTPTLDAGFGALTITRNSGALNAGDLKANGYYLFQRAGTTWNLLNPMLMGTSDLAAGAVDNAALGAGAVTADKATALIGVPVTKALNTIYEATTDGFITGYSGDATNNKYLQVLTGPTSSPTVIRERQANGGTDEDGAISVGVLVPKGWFYKVEGTNIAGLQWYPIGS